MGNGVNEQENATSEATYSDTFHKAFPQYLAMGMSAEEFWNGDSGLVKDYREAYRISHERQMRMMDESAWLHGRYMRDALQSVYMMVNGFVPKGISATPYPSMPYLQKEEEDQKEEKKAKQAENKQMMAMAYMQMFVEKFNKNFKKRQEKEKNQ